MSKFVPALLCLLLAACGGAGGDESVAANQAERASAEPAETSPRAATAGNSAASGSTAAVASIPTTWTGRFAAGPQLCSGGAWNLSRTEVTTQGETACTVVNIAEDPGATKLTLACSAEGMDTLENWTLTPQPAGALRVVREGAGRPVTVDLVRCG